MIEFSPAGWIADPEGQRGKKRKVDEPQPERSSYFDSKSEAGEAEKPSKIQSVYDDVFGAEVVAPPGPHQWQIWVMSQVKWQLESCHHICIFSLFSLAFIGAGLLRFGSSTISFTDALYTSVSAMTETSLDVLGLSQESGAVQFVVWLLIILGSPVLMSIVPVYIRGQALAEAATHYTGSQSPRKEFFKLVLSLGLGPCPSPEVRALAAVTGIVLVFWVGAQIVGWLLILTIMQADGHKEFTVWNSLFLATSTFNNCGFMTVPALPIGTPGVPLLLSVLSVLCLIGNTCFPVALRGMVKLVRAWASFRGNTHAAEVLSLILINPRSCYLLLFPSFTTRWIALINAAIITSEIVAICIAELPTNTPLVKDLTPFERFYAITFQAQITRSAGLTVLNLSLLSTGSAAVLIVGMFVSTAPRMVAVRSTATATGSLFEEGVPLLEEEAKPDPGKPSLSHQLAGYLVEYFYPLLVIMFFLLVAEGPKAKSAPAEGGFFLSMVFEVCSAYGTSGLTLSKNNLAYSAGWSPVSKYLLMAVMLLGRFRCLPDSVDPAWSLRSEYRKIRRSDTILLDHANPWPSESEGDPPVEEGTFVRKENSKAETASKGAEPEASRGSWCRLFW